RQAGRAVGVRAAQGAGGRRARARGRRPRRRGATGQQDEREKRAKLRHEKKRRRRPSPRASAHAYLSRATSSAARRADKRAKISSRSGLLSIGQAAISWTVRKQPTQ